MKKLAWVIVFLLLGCAQYEQEQANRGVWKRNEAGVSYFKTCIEGNLFIATQGSDANARFSLAGPIGQCQSNSISK